MKSISFSNLDSAFSNTQLGTHVHFYLTPNMLSHINALCINLSYLPKDQSLKFSRKHSENWRSWKMTFCFVFCYWVFQKKISIKITMAFISLILWFLQNLETGFIRTNMHTTLGPLTQYVHR